MSEQQHPFRGPETPSVGETDEDEVAAARAANRFDIRRIIGGLFLLYGVDPHRRGDRRQRRRQDQGRRHQHQPLDRPRHARLRRGMIAWALLRPVEPEPAATRGEGSGRIRRAPAT